MSTTSKAFSQAGSYNGKSEANSQLHIGSRITKEASGILLTDQRKKEIADQNNKLINRIFRVICRDN